MRIDQLNISAAQWGPGQLGAAESNSEQRENSGLDLPPPPVPHSERGGGGDFPAAKLSLARLHKLFIGFK